MYRVNAQGTVYGGNRPPQFIVNIYKMVAEMYKPAVELIKSGIKAREIYEVANKIYRPH